MTTKTKPPKADSVSVNVAAAITANITDAVGRWRAWADQLAGGGKMPEVRDLLDTAALLGIRDPGAVLAADAAVIATVIGMGERVERERQWMRDRIEAQGGRVAIAEKIAALKAEIKQLEAIVNPHAAMSAAYAASQIVGEKRQHPRLYSTTYRGEGIR